MTWQGHIASLLCAALPLAAHAAIPPEACDSASFEAVQHAAPSTFLNDRVRDYLRGGSADGAHEPAAADLMRAADLVRARLAGSIRSYPLPTFDDRTRQLQDLGDGGQPAGYASEPGEVVNDVEDYDKQARSDIDAPGLASAEDKARVRVLVMALAAFSQGVACFHAGTDAPRTQPADSAFARDALGDLLRIRASSTLFRMGSAADIRQRLRFFNTGSQQEPTVIAAHLDGRGYHGAGYRGIRYFVNVDSVAHVVSDPEARGKRMQLHPVHLAPGAADKRAANAGYDSFAGRFSIPPRTAVVFVEGDAVRELVKPDRKHRRRARRVAGS